MVIKNSALFLICILLFSSVVNAQYIVVPNTVGIGLQKDYDDYTFKSSEGEVCLNYHLGNPWSTNVTGWIVVDGELSNYFSRNKPENVFVPSGTFRYNSSCCLLPIEACFKFPYMLNRTTFVGKISSAFTRTDKPILAGTGSATGSSVAYKLTLFIDPPEFIELNAMERKCLKFYIGINETEEHCFSAPLFVLSDTESSATIRGSTIKLIYKNNLIVCVSIVLVLLFASYFVYYLLRKRRQHSQTQEQQSQTQPSASTPIG